jgi:homoaconitase/3-isopropylmalate dehydratase large subunit
MLSKKLLIGFAALGIGIASAASDYKVELTQATHVGATELKAGTYKVEVQGDKAVFKSGKDVVAQSPAKVENAKVKYPVTEVSTNASQLESISVGGTTMRIVLAQ